MSDISTLFAQLRAYAAENPEELRKDTTGFWGMPASATTGINYYDLELGAKTLVPIITPLRNRIPRTSGKGGIQANWRGIVALNAGVVGGAIADGLRNAFVQTTARDFTAAYKQIGLEDYVTFGADLAAQGFDDVKALAVRNLLWATMIEEELLTLGGVGTAALATVTPTPSAAAPGSASPAGSLTTANSPISIRCVALTLDGYRRSSVANGVPGQVTFTTADGTTGQTYNAGCVKVSAATTAAVTTAVGVVNASVATVPGAVAYAWYWAATGAGVGAEVIGAITTVPYVSITALATGTQTANTIPGNGGAVATAIDTSQNANAFDGLFTMCALSTYQPNVTVLGTPTSPGPWTEMPTAAINGTTGVYGQSTLTADGEGGVVEIDAMLKWFWDVYKLSPTDMFVSSQEQKNISSKILVGPSSGSSNARFTFVSEQGRIVGGQMVKSYLNKYTMSGSQEIPIHLHPNVTPGTILFFTDKLPYPLSNVSNVIQFRVLRDYYQLEWPLRTRRYEYGVYLHSVLQNYFPPAFAVLSGIGNG